MFLAVAWPKSHQETPLARAMRWRRISQTALAEKIGCTQSLISRAVRGYCSAELARKILDVLDPKRKRIEEAYLLLCRKLPERYGEWTAPLDMRKSHVYERKRLAELESDR